MLSLILCQSKRDDGGVRCENDLENITSIDLTHDETRNIILKQCCERSILEGDGADSNPDNLYEGLFLSTFYIPDDIANFKSMMHHKNLNPNVDVSEIKYLTAMINFLEQVMHTPNGVVIVG